MVSPEGGGRFRFPADLLAEIPPSTAWIANTVTGTDVCMGRRYVRAHTCMRAWSDCQPLTPETPRHNPRPQT